MEAICKQKNKWMTQNRMMMGNRHSLSILITIKPMIATSVAYHAVAIMGCNMFPVVATANPTI